MKIESTQHKLDNVRPPRVQITYDVEHAGAIEKKELPLVIGILADLSAKSVRKKPRMKDRKFVEIDKDNFDRVLAAIEPRVAFTTPNRLSANGNPISVELRFEKMEDFEPLAVARKVDSLRKLLEARGKLSDLLAKLDGNDELNTLLQDAVSNTDSLKQLKATGETPHA